MFDPQTSSNCPRSSRIAMPMALVLAGLFGLCVAIVDPWVVFKKNQTTGQLLPHEAIQGSEKKAAGAEVQLPAPDAQELVKFCSENVTATRSFVVFRNGTCVVVNEPCEDPIKVAEETLSKTYDQEAKFVTEMSAEGDMIVAFERPVFHRYSQSEFTSLYGWMKREGLNFLTQKEINGAGQGWTPPANAQMGLLARRRMLDDSLNPVPIKVIRAKERAVAAR